MKLTSTNAKPVDEDPTISLTNTGTDEDFRLDSIGLDNSECDTCHALYTSTIYQLGIRIFIGQTLANRWLYPAITTCLIPCKSRNDSNKTEKKNAYKLYRETAYRTKNSEK